MASSGVLFSAMQVPASDIVSLAGIWRFELDSNDQGEKDRWFDRDLSDSIPLPGTTDEAKKGSGLQAGQMVGIVHPELLMQDADTSQRFTSRLSRNFPYSGVAWYQRDIDIPEKWVGRRIVLRLERTKLSSVWIDNVFLGRQDSLAGEHMYQLPDRLPAGQHRLTIRIDNRLEKIPAAGHQVSDDTQTNWNGILGDLCLEMTDRVWMDHVSVYPDAAGRSAQIRVTLGNVAGRPVSGRLMIACTATGVEVTKEVSFNQARDGSVVETRLELGENAPLWDEFHPALHRVVVKLAADGGQEDRREVRFGLRDLATRGTQITVNGRAVFLRGKHDACVFPLTGYAPMEKAGWLSCFKVCRDYGMNHVRFHSWCPPRAAFEAADELGILLQPELPYFGGNLGGDVERSRYAKVEARRILRSFGNSPSFAMFALGNEVHNSRDLRADIIRELRTFDSRPLYSQASNPDHGNLQQNGGDDFWVTYRTKPGREGNIRGSYSNVDLPLGHVQNGGDNTLHDYSDAIRHVTCPVISHELGQYQVYPDFREIDRYTGVLRALNFEIFRERLAAAGMLDQAHDFFRASGALAVINYREDIEAALRTPGLGGFQILDLQDFPGQGTALVGILNAFMESKGLVAPEAWRMFCDATVVLAKIPKFTWSAGEQLSCEVCVADYGDSDLAETSVEYHLKDEAGRVLQTGSVPIRPVRGEVTSAKQKITFTLPSDPVRAEKRVLDLKLSDTTVRNSYSLWVYPVVKEPETGNVMVAHHYDASVRAALAAGKRVVYVPEKAAFPSNSIAGFFASDFWCYPMFRSIALSVKREPAPGTLGLLIQDGHPALSGFPTSYHSDYQWYDVVMNSCSVVLDTWPEGFKPIVQVIDNFARNHKLGLIFEARVGPGRLLVCAADLKALKDKPAVSCLLSSLVRYAESEKFAPQSEVYPDLLDTTLAPKS